jgi:hypothetical protein
MIEERLQLLLKQWSPAYHINMDTGSTSVRAIFRRIFVPLPRPVAGRRSPGSSRVRPKPGAVFYRQATGHRLLLVFSHPPPWIPRPVRR